MSRRRCCCGGPSPCLSCTHRRFDAMTEVWGRNLSTTHSGTYTFNPSNPQPDCPAEVIDMQVRGSLYILARSVPGHLQCVVQKWNVDGTRAWAIDLPFSGEGTTGQQWRPRRIDSDDSLVWIVGESLPTPPDWSDPPYHALYALDASDGSIAWSKSGGGYDVEPAPDGGVYVAQGGVGRCEGIEFGPPTFGGSVIERDAAGDPVRAFGPDGARSLLHASGKVWVGASTQPTNCFCPNAQVTVKGCVFRYDESGTLELACAGGEWVDGPKAQVPILLGTAFELGYINRLCVSPTGTILAGTKGNYPLAGDPTCLLFEIDATTGRMLASYDIADRPMLDVRDVEALAADSTNIYIVSGGKVYIPGLGARRHRGYLTGTDSSKTVDGTYTAVTASSSSMFIGGTAAGCVLNDTDAGESIAECTAAQPCEEGDFNTRGQAVVGCGCEDGVDPTCAAYIQHSFTGCLANMPSPIPMVYQATGSGTCAATGHRWTGTIGAWQPFPDLELPNDCAVTLTGEIEVCYVVGSGWQVKYRIFHNGGLFASFTATITGSFCNPPSFTFTFDGSWDFQSELAATCCGGTTACGGFNTADGCEEPICGCTSVPDTLYATLSNNLACECVEGTVITLTRDGMEWSGSGAFGSCGEKTITITLSCDGTNWSLDVAITDCSTSVGGLTVNCTPFLATAVVQTPLCCQFLAGNAFDISISA